MQINIVYRQPRGGGVEGSTYVVNWMVIAAAPHVSSGTQNNSRPLVWLMWQVSPNRNDTPVMAMDVATKMAGIPQPASCATTKNFRPVTTCQQIWRCRERARMKTIVGVSVSHRPVEILRRSLVQSVSGALLPYPT